MTKFTCEGVKQINNRISFKHLYYSYLSAFFISAGVPNGEFPEILIAKCRSRFYCTWFFVGGISCGRLMSPTHETQSMREIPAKRGRVNRYGTLPSYIFYEAPLMGQERHNPTGTSDLTLSFIFEESLLCPRCYACFRAENLLMGRKSRFEALNICFTHKCVF
jgi:hypothetical protein